MKILHVCAVGMTVEKFLLPQIDYFLKLGMEVEIACSPGTAVDRLQQQGYIIHPITIDRQIRPIANLQSIRKLTQLMRTQQYDVVHVHTPIASVLGRIAAKLAGVPKIVYTAHGFYFHDLTPPIPYWIFHTIERAAALLSDRILCVNYEDIQMIQRTHLCSATKVHYLGSVGVDLSQFNPDRLSPSTQQALRQALGIPDTAGPIVGTVGRLNHKKGSGYLIDAIAQLRSRYPGIHALIVGGELSSDPDPFEQELLAKIRKYGLESQVTLTGFRDDIPEMMELMDVFTLPTFTHEGLPTVIIEAMAMAKPVVATDIRGCREAVVPGVTGMIVPPRQSQALADALDQILQTPALARTMGNAGRERVCVEYDVRWVCQRLHHVYASMGIVAPLLDSSMQWA